MSRVLNRLRGRATASTVKPLRRKTHPVDVHVGACLRAFRGQRGMSQTKLASTVGVTFQQIQKYEKGTNRVSASMLYELAAALDVSVADFFSGFERSTTLAGKSSR